LQHQNLLALLSFSETNDLHLCSDFKKITMHFELFENTLEREIIARATPNV